MNLQRHTTHIIIYNLASVRLLNFFEGGQVGYKKSDFLKSYLFFDELSFIVFTNKNIFFEPMIFVQKRTHHRINSTTELTQLQNSCGPLLKLETFELVNFEKILKYMRYLEIETSVENLNINLLHRFSL